MSNRRILIADDDPGVLDLLEEMLQSEECLTFRSLNGEEAVDIVRNTPIDVALLDLRMPTMDGLEALREIKKMDHNIDVLIMTGYPGIESLKKLLEQGASDYIIKPFGKHDIINALRNVQIRRRFRNENLRLKKDLEDRIIQLQVDYEERTRQLRESQIKYKEIVENSNDAIVVTQDGMLKFVNPKALELTGYSREELLQIPLANLIHSEDLDMVQEKQLRRHKGEGSPVTYSFRILRKNGDFFWVETNAIKTIWEERPATVNFIRDIQERKETEGALRESQERYEALFRRSLSCVYLYDLCGNFIDANDAFLNLLGYTKSEITSLNISSLIGKGQSRSVQRITEELLRMGSQKSPKEYILEGKDGSRVWVEAEASLIYKQGKPYAIQAIAKDVTERKRTEMELRYLSAHDALTSLYNRAYFDVEIARLEQGRDFPVSILMANVAGLKSVNHSQGHAEGDEVLRQVALVLRASCRVEDVVARVAGDEFAIILPSTDKEAARKVLERISRSLETERAAQESAPFSISLCAATAEKAGSLAQTLKEADGLMYQEKMHRGEEK